MVRVAPVLLLAFLLAGCNDPGGDAAGSLPDDQAAPGNVDAGPSASDSPAPASAAPPDGAANATAPAGPDVDTYEGTWTAGVHATSAPSSSFNGRAPYELDLDGGESGVVVEMRWTPSSPLSETMGLEAFSGMETVGTVAGASPLRLTLPAIDGTYVLNARASGPMDAAGAYVTQEYTLHVAVFRGIPVDEAYAFG